MDKLDFYLIPFVYLFRKTFSILSLALFLALYFTTIVMKALQNTAIWIALICIHLILFTLSALYCLVQIRPIQFTLSFLQQSSVVYTILFWPRFYYLIIKTKEKNRYLWEILKNPMPPNGPKYDKRVVTVWQQGGSDHLMRNKIVCLNKNMHCYSHYQVQGVYVHLNQNICHDLDEALAAACAIRYYDDTLHIGQR